MLKREFVSVHNLISIFKGKYKGTRFHIHTVQLQFMFFQLVLVPHILSLASNLHKERGTTEVKFLFKRKTTRASTLHNAMFLNIQYQELY